MHLKITITEGVDTPDEENDLEFTKVLMYT